MKGKKKFTDLDITGMVMEKGVSLVEAGAGTGKTYAIAMLVLRAIVELGVNIEEILIVTFTKAATQELKSRIRARLVEARNLLMADVNDTGCNGSCGDETLVAWAAQISDKELALSRLRLAFFDIDRAGIFTIHGFCQRMLTEQALESGQLFDVVLVADVDDVRIEVADDFWRSRIYTLPPLPCSCLMAEFSTPEKLLATVSDAFRNEGQIQPALEPMDVVLARLDRTVLRLKEWFAGEGGALYRFFKDGVNQGYFKKKFAENFHDWWLELSNFLEDNTNKLPANMQQLSLLGLLDQLDGKKFRGVAKKEALLASWPLPDREIMEFLAAVRGLSLNVRGSLVKTLRKELVIRLERRGTMGFNDLILRLDRSLEGEGGHDLRRLLASRYKAALIDEFQDTDAAQYRIFSRIFDDGDHYLYLIGDPKQAIYSFRGADIHSYFRARESATRLLTLASNYRSHPCLVEEINRLFGARKDPFFLPEEVLPYHPVQAAKMPEEVDLRGGGSSLAGMAYCYLPANSDDKKGRWSFGQASAAIVKFVVHEICCLLNGENSEILQSDCKSSLRASDIAILVRSHVQGQAYKDALDDMAVPAVVAGNLSVFHTRECAEMLRLVQAIASPSQIELVKGAMTISWFGFSGSQLYELWRDERQFAIWHDRFLEYNRLWQERGFLVMMDKLLVQENVFITLAERQRAERSIVNIQHLLELVQEQEEEEYYGPSRILQWFQQMMADNRRGEHIELLLESDEDAVRIVTVHGAKGMEYPVVFCPLLWRYSNRLRGEKHQISCYDNQHQSIIDLGSERFEENRNRALDEAMAEELRLLYVALTRARMRCYIMWADVKAHGFSSDSFHSSLGYLLFPHGNVTAEEQYRCLEERAGADGVYFMEISLNQYPEHPVSEKKIELLQPMPESGRSLRTDWQMSSYSAMAALGEYEFEHSFKPGTEGDSPSIPVVDLPMGAGFGNVIHDILESLPFAAIARGDDFEELLREKCSHYGVDAETEQVRRLLKIVVSTPLPARESDGGEDSVFTLAAIPEGKCLKEMDFYFHLGRLDTAVINRILRGEPSVTPLEQRVMKGYLTGFVDLVCQYGEKYYIIDYKTNYLGDNMVDYGHAALVAAMQSHNYGLQYWIYTLVLHRHLSNLVLDYSYETHFGGVLYLFLRGMSSASPGNGIYAVLPDYTTLSTLDKSIGG